MNEATQTKEILYQVDARNYPEARKAAQEFGRNYWQESRKIRWTTEPHNTFRMVGGRRRYRITLNYVKGTGYASVDALPVWEITVEG